ncbi:MAG TPA: alpha-2-macroglobulin, partial [Anaerolineae bacterium]|nr:alpha-2-macroglobulin [Anaerolineae bacterium]
AVRYLERQLSDPDDLQDWELNQQAFMLFVLAEAGEPEIGRTVALFDYRERLGQYGKGFLAMALGLVEEDGERGRIDTLLSDLIGEAILSATGAHWEEGTVDWWTMSTDTRTTAVVLDAFARLAPDEPLAPNIVRWLMVARKDGHWETTQETAWSLIALTDWMVASGELEADYSWQVSLNGELLGEGVATNDNVDEAVELSAQIGQLFLDRANALLLERLEPTAEQSGAGWLYYTSHLQYFLPVEGLEPLDRGIVVARRYEMADCQSDCPAVSQAQVGDAIRVKLTLVAPNDLHYLVVEDPLPAGCEAIDVSLKTVSGLYEGAEIEMVEQPEDAPWWWNGWIPTHTELRDEKVALFATWMRRGTYEYTYLMRASLAGRYLTLPASAYEMYFPEVWGRGAGGAFTITE